MDVKIAGGAKWILERLCSRGYEAFLVGGCVRDLLRGGSPKDWDLCTSGRPEEVLASFPDQRVLETGLQHGTVTVLVEGIPFEVTTYRRDDTYSDGRRPDGVQFVSGLEEDLARRDFTVNAIAMDGAGTIRDPFFGQRDLLAGVIRCVGDPDQRFREDGLRVMRGLRFAGVLGFSLEQGTGEAIHRNKGMLSRVSPERIQAELNKLLVGEKVGWVCRDYVDVLSEFWPELRPMVGLKQHNPWHSHDVWEHTVTAVEQIPPDLVLRLTMLLHDIGKPLCFSMDEAGVGHFYGHVAHSTVLVEQLLGRLKYDNAVREQVVKLVEFHDTPWKPEFPVLRRWLNRLGEKGFFQLLEVKRADALAQRKERILLRLKELEHIEGMARQVLREKQCFQRKDLAVGGTDVLMAGLLPGPAIGTCLQALLDLVIEGKLPNDRAVLLEELKKLAPTQS